MLNEYFMILFSSYLSHYALVFFAEIKITPGSVSTDDDHLNFIGGEWWQLMMRGWDLLACCEVLASGSGNECAQN